VALSLNCTQIRVAVDGASSLPMLSGKHGESDMAEAEIKIPHALTAFIERDPPLKVLVIATRLAEHPGQPGFNAEAKYEMLKGIERLHESIDFDRIHVRWGMSNA
jgi:hypothetical protein